MSKDWRDRFLAYAPILLWVGVIFYLSSDNGSMNETSRFVRPVLKFLFPAAPEETLQIYHGYVRKCAHVTEYAILALLTFRALTGAASARLRKWRYLVPLILVAAIASADEFNQSFLASRTGSPRDVLLDISGGAGMIALLWLIGRRTRRTRAG